MRLDSSFCGSQPLMGNGSVLNTGDQEAWAPTEGTNQRTANVWHKMSYAFWFFDLDNVCGCVFVRSAPS